MKKDTYKYCLTYECEILSQKVIIACNKIEFEWNLETPPTIKVASTAPVRAGAVEAKAEEAASNHTFGEYMEYLMPTRKASDGFISCLHCRANFSFALSL